MRIRLCLVEDVALLSITGDISKKDWSVIRVGAKKLLQEGIRAGILDIRNATSAISLDSGPPFTLHSKDTSAQPSLTYVLPESLSELEHPDFTFDPQVAVEKLNHNRAALILEVLNLTREIEIAKDSLSFLENLSEEDKTKITNQVYDLSTENEQLLHLAQQLEKAVNENSKLLSETSSPFGEDSNDTLEDQEALKLFEEKLKQNLADLEKGA